MTVAIFDRIISFAKHEPGSTDRVEHKAYIAGKVRAKHDRNRSTGSEYSHISNRSPQEFASTKGHMVSLPTSEHFGGWGPELKGDNIGGNYRSNRRNFKGEPGDNIRGGKIIENMGSSDFYGNQIVYTRDMLMDGHTPVSSHVGAGGIGGVGGNGGGLAFAGLAGTAVGSKYTASNPRSTEASVASLYHEQREAIDVESMAYKSGKDAAHHDVASEAYRAGKSKGFGAANGSSLAKSTGSPSAVKDTATGAVGADSDSTKRLTSYSSQIGAGPAGPTDPTSTVVDTGDRTGSSFTGGITGAGADGIRSTNVATGVVSGVALASGAAISKASSSATREQTYTGGIDDPSRGSTTAFSQSEKHPGNSTDDSIDQKAYAAGLSAGQSLDGNKNVIGASAREYLPKKLADDDLGRKNTKSVDPQLHFNNPTGGGQIGTTQKIDSNSRYTDNSADSNTFGSSDMANTTTYDASPDTLRDEILFSSKENATLVSAGSRSTGVIDPLGYSSTRGYLSKPQSGILPVGVPLEDETLKESKQGASHQPQPSTGSVGLGGLSGILGGAVAAIGFGLSSKNNPAVSKKSDSLPVEKLNEFDKLGTLQRANGGQSESNRLTQLGLENSTFYDARDDYRSGTSGKADTKGILGHSQKIDACLDDKQAMDQVAEGKTPALGDFSTPPVRSLVPRVGQSEVVGAAGVPRDSANSYNTSNQVLMGTLSSVSADMPSSAYPAAGSHNSHGERQLHHYDFRNENREGENELYSTRPIDGESRHSPRRNVGKMVSGYDDHQTSWGSGSDGGGTMVGMGAAAASAGAGALYQNSVSRKTLKPNELDDKTLPDSRKGGSNTFSNSSKVMNHRAQRESSDGDYTPVSVVGASTRNEARALAQLAAATLQGTLLPNVYHIEVDAKTGSIMGETGLIGTIDSSTGRTRMVGVAPSTNTSARCESPKSVKRGLNPDVPTTTLDRNYGDGNYTGQYQESPGDHRTFRSVQRGGFQGSNRAFRKDSDNVALESENQGNYVMPGAFA